MRERPYARRLCPVEGGAKMKPTDVFQEDWCPEQANVITHDWFGFYLWKRKPFWNKKYRCWGNPPLGTKSVDGECLETDRGSSWIGGFNVYDFAPVETDFDAKGLEYYGLRKGFCHCEGTGWEASCEIGGGNEILRDEAKRVATECFPESSMINTVRPDALGPTGPSGMPGLTGPPGKQDSDKPRFSLLPWKALTLVADLLTKQAEAKDDFGWRTRENGEARHLESMQRHCAAVFRGEDHDKEHFMHLTAIVANALIALELKVTNDQTE